MGLPLLKHQTHFELSMMMMKAQTEESVFGIWYSRKTFQHYSAVALTWTLSKGFQPMVARLASEMNTVKFGVKLMLDLTLRR